MNRTQKNYSVNLTKNPGISLEEYVKKTQGVKHIKTTTVAKKISIAFAATIEETHYVKDGEDRLGYQLCFAEEDSDMVWFPFNEVPSREIIFSILDWEEVGGISVCATTYGKTI